MKIKQKLVTVAVAGAVGLFASSAANALSVVTYTGVSSFLAGVAASPVYSGSYEKENFNDGVLNAGLSISGGSIQAALPWFSPSDGLVYGGIVNAPSQSVTISFGGREMYAMGAHWNLSHAAVGGPGSGITLNLKSGASVFYSADTFYSPTLGSEFVGFVSDEAFTSVVLTEGTASGGTQETFQFDNLKYAQAVPEPETYAMLMAGLGLMGFVARRRKKAAKAVV